jgi:hypothetical protein
MDNAYSWGVFPESLCDQMTPGFFWLTANPEASVSVGLLIRCVRFAATNVGHTVACSVRTALVGEVIGALPRMPDFGAL